MQRVIANIKAGKYVKLLPACGLEEQFLLFEKLRDILVDIKNYKPTENHLFLQMKIKRIKKQYSTKERIEDIGMGVFFLALEYGLKKDDSEDFINEAKRELQMLILDAIFNDGNIKQIEYGEGFSKYVTEKRTEEISKTLTCKSKFRMKD